MDRKLGAVQIVIIVMQSLSARRAWIENAYGALEGASEIVALRKESVDRKRVAKYRRILPRVALRKESVDRKGHPTTGTQGQYRRSPQGERG